MDPRLRELLRGAVDRGDQEIEAIVRLRHPDIEVPGLRIVSRFGDIATCRLPISDIERAWRHEDVLSLKASRPLGSQRDMPEPSAALRLPLDVLATDIRRPPDCEQTGAGVIVAAIDFGCDFDHPNFKRADGTTRLLALWDQRDRDGSESPQPYGYGSVYSQAQINDALRTAHPYDTLGYHPSGIQHGTHVLDIAAGNGAAGGPVGIAPQADLMVVHLAARDTGGLATLGDSARLLEALDFIARTAGQQPWVINMSLGRQGGEHKGSSPVERALDRVLRAKPGRCIAMSVGNYHDKSIHASGRLAAGEARSLTVITDERDLTRNEIEVWYGRDDELRVMLDSPDGDRTAWIGPDDEADIVLDDQVVGRIYHLRNDPDSGDNHIDIFLDPWAPAGRWTVTLEAVTARDGIFHAWIERDEACPGCQARFDAADADSSFTTGTVANGHLPLVVGAYNPHSPGRESTPFSSAGPTSDGRAKPDIAAPGLQVLAARAAPADSDQSPGTHIRKDGTSMATPHVTGAVALCLQGAGRPLGIEAIRALIVDNTAPPGNGGAPSSRLGRGRLDIRRALAGLTAPPQQPAPALLPAPREAGPAQARGGDAARDRPAAAMPRSGDRVIRRALGEGFETQGIVEWSAGDEVGVRQVETTAGGVVLTRQPHARWTIADDGRIHADTRVIAADGPGGDDMSSLSEQDPAPVDPTTSREWQLAYRSAQPEPGPQTQLVSLLARPGQPVPYVTHGVVHVVRRVGGGEPHDTDAQGHLRYLGGHDGHLLDVWHDGSAWRHRDLTADAQPATPAATYSPCVYETSAIVGVAFRAVRGELWIITWSASAPANVSPALTSTNVTRALGANAPLVAGHPTCFVLHDVSHIVYRGTDKFIYDVALSGGTWQITRVCNEKAAADPVATTNGTVGLVAIRVMDGSIHAAELNGATWTCTPTATSCVALSAPSPGRQQQRTVADAAGLAEDSPAAWHVAIAQIYEHIDASGVSSINWTGRGMAPIGYLKGMALTYARVYCHYSLRPGEPENFRDRFAVQMAKAAGPGASTTTDAVARFARDLRALGADLSQDGVDVLRGLFTILIGLGMRESSGKYCTGRHRDKKIAATAQNSEAGLFQISYDIGVHAGDFQALYKKYQQRPSSGFLDVFSEGVTCPADDWANVGGGPGRDFQQFSKDCPAFTVELAALALRSRANHWAPINARKVQIREECWTLLRGVETAIDDLGGCIAVV
jgi:hypothetical protein